MSKKIIEYLNDLFTYSILKHGIINAIEHDYKTSANSILGKILAEYPEKKKDIKGALKKINEVSDFINNLSADEQKSIYEEHFKDLDLKKKEEKKYEYEHRNLFSFFKIKEGDYVKTAFPPGPEKYPHIGHAKVSLLNYMCAKQYNGKFSLRFEDTNPRLVKAEFYDIILENLSWLGIKWDELVYASDFMEIYREYAEKLITDGKAYMCFCDPDTSSKNRTYMLECECRKKSSKQNMDEWQEFESYPEGKAVLRLKIDMTHKNTTMRDPAIFRIVDCPHARHGTKYRAWPAYDFQNAICDGYFKISHRIRGKEWELRSELHHYIRKLFNLFDTETFEMARTDIIGMPLAGRVIRDLAAESEFGWSDPSLGTLVALKRRGFTPEAIKNFVVNTGISKTVGHVELGELIKQNKRILDNTANRYFMIKEPVLITVIGAPFREIKIRLNPANLDKGERIFHCEEKFYIEKSDLEKFENNDVIRLMDNLNFKVIDKHKMQFKYLGDDYLDYKEKGKMIIHFLTDNDNVKIQVLMPDKKIVKAIAEKAVAELKVNDIIQFERMGFSRLDSIDTELKFWFTHQ